MNKIRIIIIEDNKLLREGISIMLKQQKDFIIVAALGDKIRANEKIKTLKPNIILLDLGLVNQDSLLLVRSIKKKFPKINIIVMDLLPVQSDIIRFIEEGVSGFILKDATTLDLIETIRSVANGKKVFPSQVHGSLFSEIVDNAVNELMESKLIESIRMTEMEKKIIEYISVGLKDDEIAKKLHYSVPVIKGNIDNILEKMSLNTHVQISIYRKSGGDIVNPQFTRQNKLDKKSNLIKTKKRVNAVKN